MANLLNQLAIYRNSTGKRQIDNITEEAPILALLPFDASSEGFFHKYVERKALTVWILTSRWTHLSAAYKL